ncbi:MAG: GHKL domain-containing protein [Clostridia bacterium]|nr:GHKL domain-containing protein [Clostridia bacterium]
MIKKLQQRFIRIALAVLTVAMVTVVGIVNAANWLSVQRELHETLSFLSENSTLSREDMGGRMDGRNRHARSLVSESRWFSAFLDQDGNLRNINLANISDLDERAAQALVTKAVSQSSVRSAYLQDYLYIIRDDPRGGQTLIFLNCETKLSAVRMLAWISGLACLGGILLAWLFVTLASRKAIEPTIRNMEQQKQFITNASHELKTPLTVISANMELEQMEQPDSPWVRSTQRQTSQLRHLVDELVYLSRMEEENAPLVMDTIPAAPLLREVSEPFIAMAEYQGKTMTAESDESLCIRGDRASVQRLLSILLDNAVKYASPEGNIQLRARVEGRYALLTVKNDVPQPLTEEQCRRLFDRFYRVDLSRSKDKQSGSGIGLAIAAAITEKHGGSISAVMEGSRLVLTCKLPKGGNPS